MTQPINPAEGISQPINAAKGIFENWHLKCVVVGCRQFDVAHIGLDLYRGDCFNKAQRQQCIDKGCKHWIPE